MSEHRKIQTGEEAQQVLDNESFKTAMRLLKEQIYRQWKECPIRDREGQLLLLQLAKLSEKFEGILVSMIRAGKDAQTRIDIQNAREQSRAKQILRRVF